MNNPVLGEQSWLHVETGRTGIANIPTGATTFWQGHRYGGDCDNYRR